MGRPKKFYITRKDLSTLLELSINSIDKKIQEGYFLSDKVSHHISLKSVLDHFRGKRNPDEKDWANEFRKIKTRLARIDLDFKQGKYLKKDAVFSNLETAGSLLKELVQDSIATLPAKLAGIDLKDMSKVVEVELMKILSNYAQALNNAKISS